jgi:HEAT repeat protein
LTDYEEALELLKYPATWCEGADILVEIGDRRALIPLVRAYETPVEASKVCLLDAMDALDAPHAALVLCVSEDPEERRMAVHLMELFSDVVFLPALEHALHDSSSEVRRQARRSLRCQPQTTAWEALMVRLLESEDEEIRVEAIHSLARRRTETVRRALADRLEREPLATLRDALREAVAEGANG